MSSDPLLVSFNRILKAHLCHSQYFIIDNQKLIFFLFKKSILLYLADQALY